MCRINQHTAMNAAKAKRKGKMCRIHIRIGELYGVLLLTVANTSERKKAKRGIEIRTMPKKTIGPL